jgi:TolA-binding protein
MKTKTEVPSDTCATFVMAACAMFILATPCLVRADAGQPGADPLKQAAPQPSRPPSRPTSSMPDARELRELAEEAARVAGEDAIRRSGDQALWSEDAVREMAEAARAAADNMWWTGAAEQAQAARARAEAAAERAAERAAQAETTARAGNDQSGERAADDLYWRVQDMLDRGNYERALAQLNNLIAKMSTSDRVDAAFYWKAYSLGKLGQLNEALTTLTDMEKKFASSKWLKDAKALELEIRQASGQAVSPEVQADEEMKLMALNALMRSDPDHALPAIQGILSGGSSLKVKERALFVLGQSRLPRAREILAGVAKGGGNPDLQLRAIRYLGAMGAGENGQILDEAYRTATDPALKRAVLRSFMTAGDRARLVSLAKTESSPDLRIEAIRQLGMMRASDDLAELYKSEQSPEVKKHILDALVNSGQSRHFIYIAEHEHDPALRHFAINDLGRIRRTDAATTADASAALKSIYASDNDPEVRKAVINALSMQQNAKALVDLARSEKNPQLKKEIVSRLSRMKSQEATDYLLELLK